LNAAERKDLLADRMCLVRRPTFWDGTLLALLVILTFTLTAYSRASIQGTHLEVRTTDGSIQLDLARDGDYALVGPLGTAKLSVRDSKAVLENAPCPLKICESMGPVGKAGEVILCLPNRISVRVTGKVSIDAVTR